MKRRQDRGVLKARNIKRLGPTRVSAGGPLEARYIDASHDKLGAEVEGEVEHEEDTFYFTAIGLIAPGAACGKPHTDAVRQVLVCLSSR